MRRVVLITLAVLLVLAAAGWSGAWLWAREQVAGGWQDWMAERRADGWRFEDAAPDLGGFPLKVTADLESPAAVSPRGWRWQGPALHGEADVWDPFHIRLAAPGTHHVTLPTGRRLTARVDHATGTLELAVREGARTGEAHLRAIELAGLPAGTVRADALDLRLGPRRQPDGELPALDFAARISGLGLPAEPGPAALERWRTAGGTLEVARLRFVWAPLKMTGSGELGLDSQLRPQGTLSVEVRGLAPALDRLAAAGLIERQTVSYVKIAISALGETDEATGETRISLPLRFDGGRMYLGPVPLLRLSPVLADRRSRPGAPG